MLSAIDPLAVVRSAPQAAPRGVLRERLLPVRHLRA